MPRGLCRASRQRIRNRDVAARASDSHASDGTAVRELHEPAHRFPSTHTTTVVPRVRLMPQQTLSSICKRCGRSVSGLGGPGQVVPSGSRQASWLWLWARPWESAQLVTDCAPYSWQVGGNEQLRVGSASEPIGKGASPWRLQPPRRPREQPSSFRGWLSSRTPVFALLDGPRLPRRGHRFCR